MLSSIVTVLSLGVMLLVFASFLPDSWHRHQGRRNTEIPEFPLSSRSHEGYVELALETGSGIKESIQTQTQPRPAYLSSSWYARRRALVSLGLLTMVCLALFAQSGLADNTFQRLGERLHLFSESSSGIEMHTSAQTPPLSASQRLVRVSQLDRTQYSSTAEYNTWAYSACSAAAMTEIFNAYGLHLRVTNVLQVEARMGEISPELGLLKPDGIGHTAAQFGFKTTWSNSWMIDQVLSTANQGTPVIVSFPPDRYAGGHILVVTGGNSTSVFLADTSLWNRHVISRAQFLQWWEGFAAVVTPRS